jgi:hypothetical protein
LISWAESISRLGPGHIDEIRQDDILSKWPNVVSAFDELASRLGADALDNFYPR